MTEPTRPQPPAGGEPDAVIPGPPPKRVVGNAGDVDRDHVIESTMALAREYGPIYRLTVPGTGDRLIVSGADLVDEVCDDARFDKLVSGGLSAVRKDPVNTGLFTADTGNALWRRAHNILLPNFSMQAMQGYFPAMLDLAVQLMQKWERLNPGDEVDVGADMTRLTLDTIALCGFDYRFNSFYRDTPHPFVAAMVRTLEESQTRARQLPLQSKLRVRASRQLKADTAYMEAMVDEIVRDRRSRGGVGARNDLLGAMLEGVDKQSGERLPDVNIRAQCITFLIAGHETTSGLLSFATYFLIKTPDVAARAREEVDSVLGTDLGALPTSAQVRKLAYITQILNESLRLWPTAPGFVRYPKQDTVLGGRYSLAKGASVTVLTPMLHRDRNVWGDDADEFNPDHFSPKRRAALPANAFKPFGTGERACIGRQFALQEATLVLGMLLQRFELVDAFEYQLQVKQTLTIKPGGLRITVRPRPDRTAGAGSTKSAASGLLTPAVPLVAAPAVAAGIVVHGQGGDGQSSDGQQGDGRRAPAATGRPGSHGTPLSVLFGSNLGTAEAIATRLAQEGSDRGFAVDLGPLDDHVGSLPAKGAVIVVTASYNGTPPANAERFCGWLSDQAIEQDACAGVRFAVFGCGSTDWASTYQSVPKLVDEQLEAHGATRLHPRGEGDASADFDAQYGEWHGELWGALASGLGLSGDTVEASEGGPRLAISLANRQVLNPVVVSYQAQPSLVVANHELQRQDGPRPATRSTRHVEVALPAGTTYETGDHLGVLPRNDVDLIQRVLRHFSLDAGMFMLIIPKEGVHTHLPVGKETPLLGVLACSVELQDVATREDIELMAHWSSDPEEQQELHQLAAPPAAAPDRYREKVILPHRSLIELLEASPHCSMPFEVYLDRLPPLRPRYYSISSSPLAFPDQCSITVGVLESASRLGGGTFAGVCSGHLSRSSVGSTVFPFVRKPSIPFRPPANPHMPMIMVGCGTGLAPFRGFIQERALQKRDGVPVGEAVLFFGCRDEEIDFLYQEELGTYEAEGAARVVVASSQTPGKPKRWVQHHIDDQQAEVWRLIEAGAVIYICGDAHKMAPDVRRAFTAVYRSQTGASEAEGKAWIDDLRASHRYLEDIWGGAGAPADQKIAAASQVSRPTQGL